MNTTFDKGSKNFLPAVVFTSALGLLAILFSPSLVSLARFALQNDLYSYVLIIPAVSLYLIFIQRMRPAGVTGNSRGVGVMLCAIGAMALSGYGLAASSDIAFSMQDSIAITTFSFVALVAGVCGLLLDTGRFRRIVFPLAFLAFMAPLPIAVETGLEHFLQHGSAPPTSFLFHLAGMPVFQHDLVFELPGISIQIAPECSGIRSTLVLFMASLIAGHLFLRSPWKRSILAAVVVPLALARNGFRIFTIGELCVHVGPHMIDSDIHHKGGSIFFALSLAPFFLVLFLLVRSERAPKRITP